MHEKKCVAISLILILVISFISLITKTPMVKAQVEGYDYYYGSASNMYTTNWCQWNQTCVDTTAQALNEIYGLFASRTVYVYQYYTGPLDYSYPVYGNVWNWGNDTNQSQTLSEIDESNNNNYYFSTDLYVGHGFEPSYYGQSSDPNNPQDIGSIDQVWYGNISAHAGNEPYQQFVFNWVCWCANHLDYGPPDEWGAPYDWNPLFWNWQANGCDYCWIGFYNASAWLTDNMLTRGPYPGNSGSENIYQYWLEFFYYFALYGDNFDNNYYSVLQALNQASYETGYLNYANCILTQGFTTYWPYTTPPTPGNGFMELAGDPGLYMPASQVYFEQGGP